jgi:NAD(P)-dependent dehydrogenase (short-subunit alcohol dehydrogenase family)
LDPLFDFSGKIALVTGGSRGLGREMVMALAQRGADMIVTSRKAQACEEVAEQVRALGRRALAIGAHAGKWDEIDRMLDQAYSVFGRVDILINNAGMSPAMPSPDLTEELFDKVVGLNFKGPFRLSAIVGRRMMEGDGGVIINISSSGAIQPLPNIVPYGAAKAALNAMSRSLAAEFSPKVRVNTLSAGPFLTDIARSWTQEMRETSTNIIGRPGNPEEIVTAALALASPASSYITGAFYQVDGGY